MRPNPPLTDAEIAKKFGISIDSPAFRFAKNLSHNRPDRTICEVPQMTCPHCDADFTATFHDLGDGGTNSRELACPECERSIYIEHVQIADETDPESEVLVTLTTEPPS